MTDEELKAIAAQGGPPLQSLMSTVGLVALNLGELQSARSMFELQMRSPSAWLGQEGTIDLAAPARALAGKPPESVGRVIALIGHYATEVLGAKVAYAEDEFAEATKTALAALGETVGALAALRSGVVAALELRAAAPPPPVTPEPAPSGAPAEAPVAARPARPAKPAKKPPTVPLGVVIATIAVGALVVVGVSYFVLRTPTASGEVKDVASILALDTAARSGEAMRARIIDARWSSMDDAGKRDLAGKVFAVERKKGVKALNFVIGKDTFAGSVVVVGDFVNITIAPPAAGDVHTPPPAR